MHRRCTIFRNVYLRIFIFLLLETSDSGDGDNSYFGHNKTVFVVVMCLVSILALTAIAVCAICMKKKNINIFILLQNIGTSSNENVPSGSNSTTRSSKRPAHNQVMDLHSVATTSRSTCVPQMAVWNWPYWIEANDMVAYMSFARPFWPKL